MNNLPDHELISAYLDGELAGEEKARAEQLLATSAEARQLLEELRALQTTLQGLPKHELGEDLSQRVLRLAERELLLHAAGDEGFQWRTLPRRLLSPRNILWPLVAVSLLAMVILNQEGKDQIARDVPPPAEEGQRLAERRRAGADEKPAAAPEIRAVAEAGEPSLEKRAEKPAELAKKAPDAAKAGGGSLALTPEGNAAGAATTAPADRAVGDRAEAAALHGKLAKDAPADKWKEIARDGRKEVREDFDRGDRRAEETPVAPAAPAPAMVAAPPAEAPLRPAAPAKAPAPAPDSAALAGTQSPGVLPGAVAGAFSGRYSLKGAAKLEKGEAGKAGAVAAATIVRVNVTPEGLQRDALGEVLARRQLAFTYQGPPASRPTPPPALPPGRDALLKLPSQSKKTPEGGQKYEADASQTASQVFLKDQLSADRSVYLEVRLTPEQLAAVVKDLQARPDVFLACQVEQDVPSGWTETDLKSWLGRPETDRALLERLREGPKGGGDAGRALAAKRRPEGKASAADDATRGADEASFGNEAKNLSRAAQVAADSQGTQAGDAPSYRQQAQSGRSAAGPGTTLRATQAKGLEGAPAQEPLAEQQESALSQQPAQQAAPSPAPRRVVFIVQALPAPPPAAAAAPPLSAPAAKSAAVEAKTDVKAEAKADADRANTKLQPGK